MSKIILSCEHATNFIPKSYEKYFTKKQARLKMHTAFDKGALEIFNQLKKYSDFSKQAKISRLLIDHNRSLHHRQLHSSFIKSLDDDKKKRINFQILFAIPSRN